MGDDFLGMFRVPLKDIPATGLDTWFDLYEDKRGKVKVQGQCRLRLELAFKQQYASSGLLDQLDSAESDQCSLDDFHCIVTQTYKHALAQARNAHVSSHSTCTKEMTTFDTTCSPRSDSNRMIAKK